MKLYGTAELRASTAFLLQLIAFGFFGYSSWLHDVLGRGRWLPVLAVALFVQRQLSKGPQCNIKKDLRGKFAFVTGSSSGLGLELARSLAAMNCTVLLGCRNGEAAMTEIRKTHPKAKLHFVKIDVSDYESIRKAAKEVNGIVEGRLDYLVNNAGVMSFLGLGQPALPNGHEYHIGTNFVGSYLLTELLLPSLIAAKGRISNTGSIANRNVPLNSLKPEVCGSDTPVHQLLLKATARDYTLTFDKDPMALYGLSKACNIMHAKHIANRLGSKDVMVTSVHPGGVYSSILRQDKVKDLLWRYVARHLILKTSVEGAQTSLYTLLEDRDKLVNGGFYVDCDHRPDVAFDYVWNEKDIEAVMAWARAETKP